MKREWKPGDVAMTAKDTVALCHKSGRMIDQDGAPWSDERFPFNLRPLVVIDPEDREQVERLIGAMDAEWEEVDDRNDWSDATRRMQAALREFASPTPPKRVWTDGDVIQSEATNLVWTREDDRWLPANGKAASVDDNKVSVDDNKVSMWVESLGGACRVLREQAVEVTP